MKKQFIKVLLCGVMILSAGAFTSCGNDDLDELTGRVAVLETAIDDIKAILGNALVTGASVIAANQDEETGTWLIELSNGEKISITPGSGEGGGGGTTITVVPEGSNLKITIDGDEYVLPMGPAIHSFVYSPQTVDGIVELGNEAVTVKFLVKPDLTQADLDKATFSIAEAHVVTRAGGNMFVVEKATLGADGLVEIRLNGENAAADTHYAVALQITLGATTISSNYFIVHTATDYVGVTEDLIPNLTFVSAITDATQLASGAYAATLPAATADFLGTFNFKNLFTNLPAGDYQFVLGDMDEQNANIQGRYDFFKGCLSSDGTWNMTARPGTNGAGDADKPGILINIRQGKVIVAKVYWKVIDPLADIDFRGGLTAFEQHMEYGTPTAEGLGNGEGQGIVFEPGANSLNIVDVLVKGKLSLVHGDAMNFLNSLKTYSVVMGEEPLVYNDSFGLVVTDKGKSYAKFSQGLRWFNIQTSIASSQRRNWTMTEDEKKAFAGAECNGEIIGTPHNFDGLNGSTMAANGLSITPDGRLVTTAAYGGWALRLGVGLEFEYDYGVKPISSGCLVFLWINRRVCAEGVVDNPVFVAE